MKRSNKYQFRTAKKRKGKALTISLLISSIILAGAVTWVGLNEWNVEKSYKRIEAEIIALLNRGSVEKPAPTPVVGGASDLQSIQGNETSEEKPNAPEESPVIKDPGGYIEGQPLPSEPTFVKDILIVSKQYPLPKTYAPGEDPVAREAFNAMAAEAILSDFKLTAFSTYRSFEYQTGLYERYVDRDGIEAADRYSARPGYSEHQTGLAFDIGEVNREEYFASSKFGETEAGKWVAANAHRFGFIMRYPLGKEEITGYMHESWHFRYVGIEIADVIFKQNITLEEYLEI